MIHRVLITGGGKRVGRLFAERLSAAGHAVVIHANTSIEDAEEVAETLRRRNAKVWTLQADLALPSAGDVVDTAAKLAGAPLTALVNSASVFDYDNPKQVDELVFEHAMAVNLRAPVLLAERFATQADAGQDNCIVNILDQKLWNLDPDFFSYTLSKAALLSATEMMARAYAPSIRVNAIAPGLLLPSFDQTKDEFARTAQVNLLQRPIDLDDLADSLEFLLLNRSLTGQTLHVDNGRRMMASPRDVMFMMRERTGPGGQQR